MISLYNYSHLIRNFLDMVIVGINDGHNASVCITKDSKIFFALSEERPSRIKNFWGMPKISLD